MQANNNLRICLNNRIILQSSSDVLSHAKPSLSVARIIANCMATATRHRGGRGSTSIPFQSRSRYGGGRDRIGEECSRTPFTGTGKPEPLRGPLSGWWSRRINLEHRLVYRVSDDSLLIAQCRYHY